MATSNEIKVTLRPVMEMSDVGKNLDNLEKSMGKVKLPESTSDKLAKQFRDARAELEKYLKIQNKPNKSAQDLKTLENSGARVAKIYGEIGKTVRDIGKTDLSRTFKADPKEVEKTNKALKETKQQILNVLNSSKSGKASPFSAIEKSINELKKVSKSGALNDLMSGLKAGDMQKTNAALETLKKNVDNFKNKETKSGFEAELEKIKLVLGGLNSGEMPKLIQELNRLQSELDTADFKELEEGQRAVVDLGNATMGASDQVRELTKQEVLAAEKSKQLSDNVNRIKSGVQHFFSLTNVAQLFRRAINSAYQSVKELDAAMTQTAVVTDFSIGDMWDKLPSYTETANKLGATVKGLYETTTLYYQQGLKENEVMAISAETMKMAKIAGLDYAQATDMMTAALRGFNMEVNESSAQRINDVYSELAAITAADTEEIATAMTKTASIAKSANMEFETTAAYLSQIIETTREAPETAGTALKTVIARFTELKKAPGEIGKVDDEIVDANKIESALRQVGVALRDEEGQIRNLDQVFMELNAKWDGLDVNTQRYIATVAAGSRQQSRFLAMMSDYDRTMELVNAANSSAGASNLQFLKTQESLESKINQLKNAWNEFTMGLMNQGLIKLGIQMLTALLNTINKIIDALSFGSGVAESLISALLAGAALALGKSFFDKLFASLVMRSGEAFAAGKSIGSQIAKGVDAGTAKKNAKAMLNKKPNAGYSKKDNSWKTFGGTRKVVSGDDKEYKEFKKKRTKSIKTIQNSGVDKKALDALKEETDLTKQQYDLLTKGQKAKLNAAMAEGDLTKQTQIGNIAKTTENNLEKGGLPALLTRIGLTVMGKTTKDAENKSTWEAVKAKWSEVGAQIASNMYMLIGLAIILLIVAAIIALVAIIAALVKAAKDRTVEARLLAAQEAADKAKESFQEAKEAYEDLMSAHSDYDTMKSELDGMVEGTEAWRKKVLELNAAVIELAGQYEDLEVTWKNGVASISDESWYKVEQQQLDRMTMAQANVFSTQARVTDLQTEKLQKDTGEQLRKHYTGNYTQYSMPDWNNDGNQFYTYDQTRAETYEDLFVKDLKQFEESYGDLTQGLEDIYENYPPEVQSIYADFLKEQQKLNEQYVAQMQGVFESFNKGEFTSEAISNISKASANSYEAWRDQYRTDEGVSGKFKNGYMRANALRKAGATRNGYEGFSKGFRYYGDMLDEISGTNKYTNKTGKLTETDVMKEMLDDMGVDYSNIDETGKKLDDELSKLISKNGEIIEQRLYYKKVSEEIAANPAVARAISGDVDMGPVEEGSIKAKGEGMQEFIDSAIKQHNEEIAQINKGTTKQLKNSQKKTLTEIGKFFKSDLAGVEESLALGVLQGTMDALDESQLSEFTNDLQKFGLTDLSGPIDTMDRLNKAIEEGSNDIKAFALSLKGVLGDSFLSVTNQANDLFDALSASDSLDNIKEEVDGQSKITANAILEYSKTNDQLKKVLDNNDVSANAVAAYYQAISEGSLSAASASSKFLEALNQVLAAESMIQDSLAFVNNFNAKQSATEIGTGFSEYYEKFQELLEKGAYGDQQLIDYAKVFFGDDTWDNLLEKYKGDTKAALNEINSYLPQFGGNLYAIWTDLAGTEEMQGFISIASDGSISFDMSKIESVESLKQKIMAAGYSETMAEALIGDAETYSGQLKTVLGEKGLKEGLETLLNNAATSGNKMILLKDQIETIATAAGKSYEEVEALIKKATEAKNVEVQITAAIKTADGKITNDFRTEIFKQIEDSGTFDVNETYQMLIDVGLDETAAKEAIMDLTSSVQQSGQNIQVTLDGKTLKETGEALYTKVKGEISLGMEDGLGGAEAELAALEMGRTISKSIRVSLLGLINLIPGATDFFSSDIDTYYNKEIQKVKDEYTKSFEGAAKTNPIEVDVEGTTTNKTVSAYDGGSGAQMQKDSNLWINTFDRLYNLTEQINEQGRIRNNLQREYNRLLTDELDNSEDLLANHAQQLLSLKQERELQRQTAEGRLEDVQNTGKQKFKDHNGNLRTYDEVGASQFAAYDAEAGVVQINWDAINQITDENFAAVVEDYVSKLEENASKYEESTDSIEELTDQIAELNKKGIEDYISLENMLKDALVKEREEEITELQTLNQTIYDTNSKIIDAMREQIDLERQIRDNTQKEEDIADKEARLAYLRRDTSGANAVEIMELEKELEDDRESYRDSLIDQELENLSDANQEAYDQRNKQITLMQQQLEYDKDMGNFWQTVYSLAGAKSEDEAIELLKKTDGFQSMSKEQQNQWINKTKQEFKEARQGQVSIAVRDAKEQGSVKVGGTTYYYNKATDMWGTKPGENTHDITYDTKTGKFIANKATYVDPNKSLLEKISSKTLGTVNHYTNYTSYYQQDDGDEEEETPDTTPDPYWTPAYAGTYQDQGAKKDEDILSGFGNWVRSNLNGFASASANKKNIQTDNIGQIKKDDGKYYYVGYLPAREQFWVSDHPADSENNYLTGAVHYAALHNIPSQYHAFIKAAKTKKDGGGWLRFATGGLADFTGPAWLDGTKSHPELVLNARDTENFIALKDILASTMKDGSGAGALGNAYFDIDINVEEISDDYDVQQLVDKVKEEILEDSGYRNVNVLNWSR